MIHLVVEQVGIADALVMMTKKITEDIVLDHMTMIEEKGADIASALVMMIKETTEDIAPALEMIVKKINKM